MKKYNKELNVYDASVTRMKYIFDNFNKVYVSFSGGKDSGVLLNLAIDYVRKNNLNRKIGVLVMDNECNFTHSLNFMHKIIQDNIDVLEVYWCCLPITLPCTVSSYSMDWQCWNVSEQDKWVAPRPKEKYIVTWENKPFDWFRENMLDKEFYDLFGKWYANGDSCACLIGIRADESLNRFRAIMNDRKVMHGGNSWTKQKDELIPNVYNCYPIYDWKVQDIWVANEKFQWEYNKLYDIFWKAGLTISQMRVASPFMSESKSSLNLYRVIDPHVWRTLCARVHGANFAATYGKAINYNSFKLPAGHTWKSFTKFLLDTLPKEVSENFKMRFIQSIKYWGRVGRGLDEKTIEQLKEAGIPFKLNGFTHHGRQTKQRVVLQSYPDQLDVLTCHNSDVASWKRFAITILKNDHTCKYMGLAPTKEQAERQRIIQNKYKKL